jgi:hypothetical protein
LRPGSDNLKRADSLAGLTLCKDYGEQNAMLGRIHEVLRACPRRQRSGKAVA